jgi:hypothetical protein
VSCCILENCIVRIDVEKKIEVYFCDCTNFSINVCSLIFVNVMPHQLNCAHKAQNM